MRAAVDAATPSVEEFGAAAEAFLAERWPLKRDGGPRPFVWGEGSDEMKVFQEPDPEAEADELAAVRAWRRAVFDAGYGWITGPVQYGGAGLRSAYEKAFTALTRRYAVPGDAMLTVGLGMIAPTILSHGTDEQRRRWLPALYRGDRFACQLFSEPDAGSDLAGLKTRAVRDGDVWRISGQKVWTSGAHLADIGITADTGEWGTYAWTSLLLGGPGYRLGGGTDEIMRNILAERVLGLPR